MGRAAVEAALTLTEVIRKGSEVKQWRRVDPVFGGRRYEGRSGENTIGVEYQRIRTGNAYLDSYTLDVVGNETLIFDADYDRLKVAGKPWRIVRGRHHEAIKPFYRRVERRYNKQALDNLVVFPSARQ